MAYAKYQKSESGVSESALDKVIRLVESFVETNNELPWRSPYFFKSFNSFVNVLNKERKGILYPDGCPYSGMVNNMLLFIASQHRAAANGLAQLDPRFVARSKVLQGEHKCHKDAALTGGPLVTGDLRLIPIYVPDKRYVPNKEFDTSKPKGKDNPEKVEIFTGKFSIGYVINVSDTNLEEIGVVKPLPEPETRENPPIEELETLLRKYPQDFGHEPCIPHYNLVKKNIRQPALSGFVDPVAYYATWIHEMSHYIGDMLGQVDTGSMLSTSYSEEELRAELTKVFVLGELGFSSPNDTDENSAAYLAHWMKRIKEKPLLLLEASKAAGTRGRMILESRLPAVIKNRESFPFLPPVEEHVTQ